MIKRTIYFGNPAYLSLSNAQMIVRLPEVEKSDELSPAFKKEATASFPIEDLGIVVLDHKQLTITQALLEALMENNTVVMTCNQSHLPTGLLLPLSGNTIQNERYRDQLDASEPLKKQLWAQTTAQKIRHQAYVLKSEGFEYNYLTPLYKNIKSGDIDNCEATAAAYYWGHLFQAIPEFRRFREGISPNNYLNYGYALLRATMARSIVGAGLLPTLGIHHHNRYNAFCLADDLMEPYRPYIDLLVLNLLKTQNPREELTKADKAYFLQIPTIDVMIDGERSPLMNATVRTAVSLVKCFSGEAKKLLYPEL
jgi:CRISPR-associated protein Cas1